MPVSITANGGTPICTMDSVSSGPLSGTTTALAGVAVAVTSTGGSGRPALATATLNVHGPTGSLVTVQIFESVSSTVLGTAQVVLGGNGSSDDYRTIALQAAIVLQPLTSYGLEISASVAGGSAAVIGGGISVVATGGLL